jgi:hypothetical protein
MPRPVDICTESPIARVLAKYKAEHKLSFRELSRHVQVSPLSLGRMVKRGLAPDVQMLKRLARFFQWTPAEVGEMAMWPGPAKKVRKKRDAA